MASTQTGQGWLVEKDVVDERQPLPRLTGAQITALNARIAAGSNDFPPGTQVIRIDDEVLMTVQGVGVAAQFVVPVTSISALTATVNANAITAAADSAAALVAGQNAQTSANTAQSTAVAQGATTGDFKFVQRAAAPAGWIVANGQTIGNVGSGSTRENVDTLALFTAWWTDYSNAQLPIQTSAGAGSTRGASAAADWAALKRLTVFDLVTLGRFPRPAGSAGVVNGTAYADTLASHTHGVPVAGGTSGSTPRFSFIANDGLASLNTGVPSTGAAAETAPKHIGMLPCYKL